MTAPLSQYFIYTSHNTYLTGNQLSSDCSDVPIIQALQRGVRGIELDLWPNSEKDNVNVLHGRTLTTPVELVKCLRSIGDHAFCASEYPVIIILEDHLTPDLLAKVAEMVTQTFGEMLFSPGPGCVKEFPSLEALKHRIIMSKPAAEYLEDKEFEGKQSGYQEGQEAPDEAAWGKEVLFVTENDDLDEGKDDRNEEDLYEVPEYKRIIGIHAGKGKGGLQDWLRVDSDKVRRLSLSELELEKASINHGEEIVRLLLIWVKDGILISGTHILMHILLQISLQGLELPGSLLTLTKKTKTVEDNWLPAWNEVFEFPLTVPELALLRIEVHEYDMSGKDDFGGQTCLPVWEIRTGIGAVPLHNQKGEQYKCVKLLMRFEFV